METTENKWTEIELLPEWSEEFYDVYTAKKYGKWVMLKTLKPHYKNDGRFKAMIEAEFDVRYNLAHPNIVVINDFEEVPGLGMCIITDDVYGKSLRKLIDENAVESVHLERLCSQLVDAMDYIQRNHVVHSPIRPETIIYTENINNLKLIDVGFDQKDHLSPADVEEDIYNFGVVLKLILERTPGHQSYLDKIAERCTAPDPAARYRSIHDLRMALAHRSDNKIYIAIIVFLLVVTALLVWLNFAESTSASSLAQALTHNFHPYGC